MEDAAPPTPKTHAAPRKPRIALMGEFSAGKSTLTNLLIGDTRIPMRVTATQLPPVWLSHGTEAPYREDLSGQRYPIDGPSIDGIPVRDTAFIRLFVEAEVLEVCDIIDTPGISDPNMPAEIWQRAAHEADGVIWLTHATQAWRQSEAAVWNDMPDTLRPYSMLLVTRIDKLLTERDRERVLARIGKEAGPLFREILPISLIQALEAGDSNPALWEKSGGATFSEALLSLIGDLQRKIRLEGDRPVLRRTPAPAPAVEAEALPPRREVLRIKLVDVPDAASPAAEPAPDAVPWLRVVPTSPAPEPAPEAAPEPALPRRVHAAGAGEQRTPRPRS
jgi:hypothetical protein